MKNINLIQAELNYIDEVLNNNIYNKIRNVMGGLICYEKVYCKLFKDIFRILDDCFYIDIIYNIKKNINFYKCRNIDKTCVLICLEEVLYE